MKQPTELLKSGTSVVVAPNGDYSELGGSTRPSGRGSVTGVCGGMGGDVYWVQVGDGAWCYCFDEMELAE